GNEQWVKRYDGPGNGWDVAHALDVDASGNVSVTGYSTGSGTSADYATIKYDSEGNEQWMAVARYNGPGNSADVAKSLAVDVSGNIYVTGYSTGSGTNYDYATIKYDPAGNEQWVKRYDGPGNSGDSATDLAVDASGNVYVTGSSFGGLETGTDYATIKYDPDGNELWQRRYNGPGNSIDRARSIAVDSSGNIYVTGTSYGIDADYGRLDADYATIKYDSAGNEQWVKRYDGGPGSSSDDPSALVIDSSGNIYVTGYSRGIYNSDYATIKYDQDGNELWVKRYDRRDDWATALAVDASGNVYVTGSSYTIYADYRQDTDYVTIKYDPDGNELWMEAARYDGPGYRHSLDIARSIAVDDAGNIYVTGHSNGSGTEADYATIKYDPDGNQLWVKRYDGDLENSWDSAIALALDSSGNIYVTGYSNGSGTDRDYTTIKYDPTGNEQWIKRYDGPGNDDDVAADLAVDSSDNIYVTGYSNGSGTKYDYATIKYDPAGKEQWVKRYNGPGNSWDWATALAVDSSGNIYVTGESRGRGTHADYATIKYVNILTISDTDTGVTMTFSEVTSVGSTTITVSNEGPSPPTGFQLNGVYYEITTSVTFSGSITICINYDDTGLTPEQEDNLALMHYDETISPPDWVNITTSHDMENNIICGETDHLSAFGLMYDTPPEIISISGPLDPVAIGTYYEMTGIFTDPDDGDTHTALWDLGDGTTSAGTIDQTTDTVTNFHQYNTPGVYIITLTVADAAGESGTVTWSQYIVIYDPSVGFVTAGGWINSPSGAYSTDPSLTGKASFGFVAKYKKGSMIPMGNTEFQFKAGDLNFHSDSFEWLVIAGEKAMLKGTGSINGEGSYKFLLTAIDGNFNGGNGVDKFRIKIWTEDETTNEEIIIYDNGLGVDDTTEIGGGNILIHKP
ncbi:MAG: SBBP repeat-containing protein, partial [Candidatus Kariarchaeaceae archaeon]